MKKQILLLGVALLSLSASAVTVDDLMKWGGYVIENSKSDRSHNSNVKWLSSSAETKFEKVSDTQIRLTGMFDDEYTFTFTLANGYGLTAMGTPAMDGNQLVLTGASRLSNNKSRYYLYGAAYQTSSGAYTVYTNSNVVGTITEDGNGGYKITFPSIGLVYNNQYIEDCYDAYELELFEPNVKITADVYDFYNDAYVYRNRQSVGRVDFNGDGTFNLLGLAELGYAINASNQLVPVKGTLYEGNEMELTRQQHMLFAEEAYTSNWGTSYSWSSYLMYEIDAEGNLYYNVTGTWDDSDVLSHKGTNTWVTNDGDCRTTQGLTMYLNDFTFASTDNIYNQLMITPIFENTKIEMTEDATHAVELKINHYGVDDEEMGVYLNATIHPVKNHDYVESYDIYMVEGKHSSVKNSFFSGNLHGQTGHMQAIHVTNEDYYTDWGLEKDSENTNTANRVAANGEDQTVNLFVPLSALPNNTANKAAGYTFFVRTNYTAESELAPTFHDMKYFTGTPTGIDTVEAEDFIGIHGGIGTITVNGAENVSIHTLAGAEVYAGAAGEVALPAGIYIVKADSKVQKVVVK